MVARAISLLKAGQAGPAPFATIALDAAARHLRRKLLALPGGGELLVDLPDATVLCDGDRLWLEDGRTVAVEAAAEDLFEVRAQHPGGLVRLAWHLGNRHLEAQIGTDRILIRRDHVIAAMLDRLGAKVRRVSEPFAPERGAYHGHEHGNGHVR